MGAASVCGYRERIRQSSLMPSIAPVPYKTLIAVFERAGFVFDRQRGDHMIYTKPGIQRPLVIPAYHEVPVFIIKNLLRTAGVSREQYFDLLQNL
jgi:predicted RNA binding protein YcfA (HicA-like mRNA interferase family)